MMQSSATYMCPHCHLRGNVVKRAPQTERKCPNGHRWADGVTPYPSGYIPMGVKVNEAMVAVRAALSALQQAETMIKDCASLLSPAQRVKLAVNSELHQIEQSKARLKGIIEMSESGK
jgi:hypothetical protein